MAKKAKERWTSEEVVACIRRKFSDARQYAVFEQVNYGTGARAGSWIDVVVMYLWPSAGLGRSSFEVKVSRSDFLNELKNPHKNEWARQYFHEFWFVTAPGVVVDISEIPEGDGWMLATRGGLRVKRAATRRRNPAYDDCFMASLCRSARNEVNQEKNRVRDSVLAESVDHQEALRYAAACKRFLKSRDVYIPYSKDDEETIYAALNEATLETQAKEDCGDIFDALDEFQGAMVYLGDCFAVLATVGLAERDALGQRLVRGSLGRYYGEDARSIAYMREIAKHAREKDMEVHKYEGIQSRMPGIEALLDRARAALARVNGAMVDKGESVVHASNSDKKV